MPPEFLSRIGGSGVKSVQFFSIDLNGQTSQTATIAAVDPNNALLIPLGGKNNTSTTLVNTVKALLEFTNSTTITASRYASEAQTFPVGGVVIEFYPGILRSVQRGTIDLNGVTSNTATIAAVNVAKTVLFHLGYKVNLAAGGQTDRNDSLLALTNLTTVTASLYTNPGAAHLTGYQAAEFY